MQKRIQQLLKDRTPQFCSSIISLVNASKQLQACTPMSIAAAAMIPAALDLPINANLGFAYIVPYKDHAQFQMGYKGYIQLAMRSGQYRALNVCTVFEGELVSANKLTGELVIDESKRASDNVLGYAAFMRLSNGYEHAEYWPRERVEAHSEQYSQAVRGKKQDSPWFTNFDAMAKKTVIKSLISHWGPMSVQMQTAILEDQAAHAKPDDDPRYVDNETAAASPGRSAGTILAEKLAKAKDVTPPTPDAKTGPECAAVAALDSVQMPVAIAEMYLRAVGNLAPDKPLAAMDADTLLVIVADPAAFKRRVSEWMDQQDSK
jgi:recombination protein RecT